MTSRFELRRILGIGGMGTVYEAHDRARDRLVAVKTLRAFDPFQLYCLKNELRALADLVHPNLVPLYELVQEGDGWWLVMERIFGVSVASWVRAARALDDPDLDAGASVSRIRESFAQVAEGLAALHRAGKLHRDLKPTNVLVESSGRTVLLDFGLVVPSGEQEEPAFMRRVGTSEYLSPERMRGEPAVPASDWYALGVMLYEALTGMLPRNARSLTVSPLRPAREVDPRVPEDLSLLCDELLSEDPAKRPGALAVLGRLRGEVAPFALPDGIPDGMFFGREAELSALTEAFVACQRDGPSCLFVEGESGIGKTALLEAFVDSLRKRGGARVLSSRCLVAETSPYKGVDGLIDGLTAQLLALPADAHAQLAPVGIDALAAMFPVLRRVPSIDHAVASAPPNEQPVRVRRRQAIDALRALCRRLGDDAPLVMCVDDIQWGDQDAAHLLADLCATRDDQRGNASRPFLLLLGHPGSAEAAAPYGPLSPLAQGQLLRLTRLPQATASHLAASILEQLASPELVEQVTRLSRGHPIVVRELALHLLRQTGQSEVSPPSDLADLVVARLSSLSADERQLVELISLLGRPVPLDMLPALCTGPAPAEMLGRSLCAQRLLRVYSIANRPCFELFHDRLRVMVIEATEQSRRAALHAHLATTLSSRADVEAELLSHHFAAAGQLEQAASYALQAGKEALASLAFGRAAALFERVLSLRPELPDDERRAVLHELAVSFEGLGLPQRAAETWLSAVDLAQSRPEALTLTGRAAEQWLVGGYVERGLDVLHRIAGEVGIRIPRGRLRATLDIVYYRIRTALHQRFTRGGRTPPPEQAAILRLKTDASFGISKALGLLDMDFGVALHARSLLYALQSGDALRIALGLSWDASFRGALRGAADAGFLASINKAEALARELGDGQATAWCALARGTTTVLSGKYDEGLEHLEQAHQLFSNQPRGVAWELTMTRVVRAGALAWSGRVGLLMRDVGAWIEEAEERGDAYAGMVLRMRASNGIRRLALDQPEALLFEVEDQLARWPRHPMVEDLSLRYGHFLRTFACLAMGRRADAGHHLSVLRADPARRFVYMPRALHAEHETLFGLVGLAAQVPRIDEAKKLSRRLHADQRGYGKALGSILEAAASLRAEHDESAALLRAQQACSAAGMSALAQSARLLRGMHVGGDEGARELAEAERWFAEQDVRSPERFARFWLTPWLLETR